MNVNREEYKRSKIDYIDIIMAFMNALIIIFPLVLVPKNIFISIIGILLSCGNFTLIIYIFHKKNPFYTYYCYVILLYGTLFLLPSSYINPILIILFIPELIYFLIVSKGKNYSSALSIQAKYRYLQRYGFQMGLNLQRLNQQWDNINPDLEKKLLQYKKSLEEQYKTKKILISSLILSLSWLTIFILYTILFWR